LSVQLWQVLNELFSSMNVSSYMTGFTLCRAGNFSFLLKKLGEAVDFFMGGKTQGLDKITVSSLANKSSSTQGCCFIGGNSVKGFFLPFDRKTWPVLLGTGEMSTGQSLFFTESLIYYKT